MAVVPPPAQAAPHNQASAEKSEHAVINPIPSAHSQTAATAAYWIDGPVQYHDGINCPNFDYDILETSYSGYWGTNDLSYPKVGDVYWGHIVVGISNPCGGGDVINTEVILPPGTQFHFDPGNGYYVRCFYANPVLGTPAVEVTNDPSAGCTQAPTAGSFGNSLGFRTVPSWGLFEIQFPIVSAQELTGSATSTDKVTGLVQAALGTAGGCGLPATWSCPSQWVWVPSSPLATQFGNVDCGGGINSVDALKVLRYAAGLSVTQTEPCPDPGQGLANGEVQGDVDCSNTVNSVDALKLLRYAASLSVSQNEPCPDMGS
jgi:hypothetical protein